MSDDRCRRSSDRDAILFTNGLGEFVVSAYNPSGVREGDKPFDVRMNGDNRRNVELGIHHGAVANAQHGATTQTRLLDPPTLGSDLMVLPGVW